MKNKTQIIFILVIMVIIGSVFIITILNRKQQIGISNYVVERKNFVNNKGKYIFDGTGRYPRSFTFDYPSDNGVTEIKNETDYQIAFKAGGNECAITVLPRPFGYEDPNFIIKEEQGSIYMGGKEWRTLIWRDEKGEIILYMLYNKEDDRYDFRIDNIDNCMDSYKEILSTFRFIDS